MQNWNQWHLPAGTIAPVPQSPVGYATATDPTTLMQSYMQYYNQPAPSGYTAEQWAAAQQQGWAQWQQWQQQYQQWQAQYGDKYQETMKHFSAQNMNLSTSQAQLPSTPHVQPPPPPLPKEDMARPPPLPPANTYHQFTNMPPPHQNNLPLFPAKVFSTKTVMPQADATSYPPSNHQQPPPPLPGTSQQQLPPLPPEIENNRENIGQAEKRDSNVAIDGESSSAKKLKLEEDDTELTEAEKTFDAQFKQWEEQFNKWKQQNANHPDKTQYKQYEAKWTSWREKLLERREQMRKKREQQKQIAITKTTSPTTEVDKNDKMAGDDKIFNILSNTENQGLINNLLGIGKTLGLTGKQQNVASATSLPPPPPPPPPPQTTTKSSNQFITVQETPQSSSQPNINSNTVVPSWSNQQQWGNNQPYNSCMEISGYRMPGMSSSAVTRMPYHPSAPFGHQLTSPNFTQPPPSLLAGNMNSGVLPNFSQPPPNVPTNNNNNNNERNQERPTMLQNAARANVQDCPSNINAMHFSHNLYDRNNPDVGQKSNFIGRGRGGPGDLQDHHFMRREDSIPHNSSGNEQNQFIRPCDAFNRQDDPFNEKIETQSFRDFSNSLLSTPNNLISNNDGRFGSTNERFATPINERFVSGNNRFGPTGNNKFISSNERFGSNLDRVSGPSRFSCRREPMDRLGSGNEHRFDRPENERYNSNDHFEARFASLTDHCALPNNRFDPEDRSFPINDRFGPNPNENLGSNDRFNRVNNVDCFDSKDANDHHQRGDIFGNNFRSFNRNSSFSPPHELSPELRKLMEKRKAASDIFKPSFISDSERTSIVGSLSESFKKIAGDSPFRSSIDSLKNRTGLLSANTASSIGPPSSNFQVNSSALDSSSSYNNYSRKSDSSFNNARDHQIPPLMSLRYEKPSPDNLAKYIDPADCNKHARKDTENCSQDHNQQSQLTNVQSQFPAKYSGNENTDSINPDSSSLQIDSNQNTKNVEVIEQTEKVDNIITEKKYESAILREDDSESKKDDNTKENKISTGDDENSQQQQQQQDKQNNGGEKQDEGGGSGNNDESILKKSESLPFMGENDPRPEDLNIEPPPELPNLSSVPANRESESQNIIRPLNEVSDNKRPIGNPFDMRFPGPREIEVKTRALFGPRGPPLILQRPYLSTACLSGLGLGSGSGSSLGSGSGLFPPLKDPPNAIQFRRNVGSDNSGRLSPKKFNNEQYSDERDHNDGSLSGVSQELHSDQFGPANEQFGQIVRPRASENEKFDIQVGLKDITALPFASRNSGPLNSGNDEIPSGFKSEFDSRDPTGDLRRLNNAPFRVPHFGDSTQCNLIEPNSDKFNRTNERLPDKLPPSSFDNPGNPFGFCSSRKFNEGLSQVNPRSFNNSPLTNFRSPHPSSPNDSFSQGRHSPKNFDENHLQDTNDESFHFKGDPGSVNYTPRDFVRRNNAYTRREQFDDTRRFENLAAGSRNQFDRNYSNSSNPDVEIRKDNIEFAKCVSTDTSYKKEFGENSPLRLPYGSINDSWRNKFNDQRNFNRNSFSGNSSQFDDRSRMQRNTNDVRLGYNETDLDRQSKFHSSNLFVKRSQSIKSPMDHSGEFCAQRQYNYNHGEGEGGGGGGNSGCGSANTDKKLIVEYTPTKVIDYGHTSKPAVDYHSSMPVERFDYAHGDLKPMISEHRDQLPRKDFKNWMESEQANIKEHMDRMKSYENPKDYNDKKIRGNYDNYDARRSSSSSDYGKQRIKERMDWHSPGSDRRFSSERERRENEDRKERSSIYDPLEEQRSFLERDSSNDHQNGNHCHQNERNIHRERIQETCENSRREMNKDIDKADNRLKGSVNWQENSNKSIVDMNLQDTSLSDTKKNVVESSTSKTLELSKLPNCTMVDDLLCSPGRQNRPPKIAIILRGPPGSGKSFVAKLIKDKEVEQGGSAPRILSLDDYFLVEKEIETKDDNGKKMIIKEMVYEYEEAMESSYLTSLIKAFKKNITDGYFNFIILDCINEKISDYEDMWSFAKTKGFKVYVCEMEMDLQICLKRNIHNRTEEEINRIIDYFEPTPSYHQKLDVNSMLQEQAIEEVDMEDSQETQEKPAQNEDSQDSHDDTQDEIGVSKWEKMEAEDKLDRLDGLAKKKNETNPQTIEDFLQVPDYYNMEDNSGKKRVRWADLEERKEQEKMRAVGFVVGHTNWDRMMDPTKGGSALTRTKYI